MLAKLRKLDDDITRVLRMDAGGTAWWKTVTFLAHSGDSWFWLIGLGFIWLFFPQWRATAAFLIISILLLAVVVMGIKFTVRRSRPPGEWGAVYRNADPHSFPSGHAARVVMLAVLAILIGPVWLAVVMSLWALGVSFSRIFTSMHYLSDVLAGMLLGILAALILNNLRPAFESSLPFLF